MRDETRGAETLVALITRACQLDCVYCRFRRDRPAMSPELLRRCVEALVEVPAPEGTFQFLGGEPLLRFDLIQEGIGLGESLKGRKRLSYAVTTNGLLLDERKLAALARFPVRWQLSLDGPSVQEENRPQTARGPYPRQAFDRALRLLVEAKADFAVHSVVRPSQVSLMVGAARHFLDAGAPQVHFQYEVGALWSMKDALSYFRQLARVAALAPRYGFSWKDLMDANEPAIMSRSCTVDTDGKAYLGCTVPAMELVLPRLKKANLLGDIRQAGIEELIGRGEGALERLLALYPDDPRRDAVIKSNLRMGWLSHQTEAFLRRRLGQRAAA